MKMTFPLPRTMGDVRSQVLLRGLFGGVLAGAAPAAAGPLLMLPALALLWSVATRPRVAALWGLLAVLISHRWLLALHPLTWMGIPAPLSLPIAITLWLICGAAAALLLLLWSLLARWWFRSAAMPSPLIGVFLLSLVWTGVELLLEGSPLFWIGLGGSVLPLDRPLAGLSRWLGSGGLAMLQLFWGWGLWQLSRRGGRGWPLWLISLVLAHGLGARLLVPPEAVGELKLAAWQPAVPTREKFSVERQQSFARHLERSLQQAEQLGAEALVAPEGTLPSRWRPSVDGLPLPLLSGGFRWVRGQQRSSLLLAQPGQPGLQPLLDKHRLVPLGEWLPPLPAGFARGLSAVGGLEPGSAPRLARTAFGPAGVAICYELSHGRALAAATADGAEWLLSIANLDPYPELLQRQFLALAQLRAIESGRDLLSVGNTGPTAVVQADGHVQRLLPAGEEGVELAELQRRRQRTAYVQLLGWRFSA